MNLPLWEDSTGDWEAPMFFPRLTDEKELWFDFETDGTDIHESKPVGLALATRDASWYFPTRHAGGNMPEEKVKQFARDTFKGKTLIGSWTKFDTHMSRNWGVRLDELNVTLRDIQHQACLLDERRRKSGLDLLAKELLGRQKVELPFDISQVNMTEVHASQVGPYGCGDVELTRDIDFVQRPLIANEDLQRVLDLEDSIILPVVEMEFNGSPLDMELLSCWRNEVRTELEREQRLMNRDVGFGFNPDAFEHMQWLFRKLELGTPFDPEEGGESYARALIEDIEHPWVQRAVYIRLLKSLLSKFLDKYWTAQRGGVLYYNLHQLRADEYGTITGRFSSAGWQDGKGANIQQVFAVKKQPKQLRRWPVRRLFVPAKGRLWCSADARQLQYRLFADLARNPAVLAAYAKDPYADYHTAVTDLLHATTTSDMPRELVKNVNFALIFGAKEKKIASMIRKSLPETKAFLKQYHAMMPEIEPLIARVEKEIRERDKVDYGYVRTKLGRRRRYRDMAKLYSGLNAHIQGTEADIMKSKLRLLYDERQRLSLTMRSTVHDAVETDVDSKDVAREVKQLLDQPTPTIPTIVPILWEVETGPNWADLEKVA